MYNLLVSGIEGYWDENSGFQLDRDRVLSNTPIMLKTVYGKLDEDAVQAIRRAPCLLMYKFTFSARDGISSMRSAARIARISDVVETDGRVFVMFDVSAGMASIDSQKLSKCWKSLGIDIRSNENSRTHWAIKDIDLEYVLRSAGLWPAAEAGRSAGSPPRTATAVGTAGDVPPPGRTEAPEVVRELREIAQAVPPRSEHRPRMFIVHGRNDGIKNEVARWLAKIGVDEIVLHEQPSQGRSILEKFRDKARDVSFAIVVATPDDVGGLVDGSPSPRARQNVILELGFFLGSLGPGRVAVLRCDPRMEIPSDYAGIVLFDYDARGAWKVELAREFRSLQIPFDLTSFL